VGKKAKAGRLSETVTAEEFSRRLDKLRKRARKAARGDGGGKSREALRRWRRLEALGLKSSCCGKAAARTCRCCPRIAADLVLAPLSERLPE
jgi:hypothetical protein